ncbi:MAG: hypothetical protein AAGB16_08365 [Pseudomonadota bacterium]
MDPRLSFLTDWFNTTISGSPIWAGLGLAAAGLIALMVLWFILRIFAGFISTIGTIMASRKRRSQQGFGIAVAPIRGPKGTRQTKAIIAALEEHLEHFSFGSPFEIVRAPRIRAKGVKGLRAIATKWLEKSSTDLILWGYRRSGRKEPSRVEVLSCGGSLSPAEAMHTEGLLPFITKANQETTSRVTAYLIARALQPGLADGSAFKAEKLAPVADILIACLEGREALPEQTQLTLETDYCSMALHLGGEQHLMRVMDLRRRRIASDETLQPAHEIQARIDLGRALLALSDMNFDPVRVREAMDHLKVAVDLLRTDPVLQLAQATNQAVQQGQAMLANRKRFSVTGGSTL